MTKRIEFVLTLEALRALNPCDAEMYWRSSPRRETLTEYALSHFVDEDTLRSLAAAVDVSFSIECLVYREGWEEEMAVHAPSPLMFLALKGFGELTEDRAHELISAAKPERTRLALERAALANARAAERAAAPPAVVSDETPGPWWWERPWTVRGPEKA